MLWVMLFGFFGYLGAGDIHNTRFQQSSLSSMHTPDYVQIYEGWSKRSPICCPNRDLMMVGFTQCTMLCNNLVCARCSLALWRGTTIELLLMLPVCFFLSSDDTWEGVVWPLVLLICLCVYLLADSVQMVCILTGTRARCMPIWAVPCYTLCEKMWRKGLSATAS